MDNILPPVEWQHTLLYINNVVVFSKAPEEHLSHGKSVLNLTDKTEIIL